MSTDAQDISFEKYHKILESAPVTKETGKVIRVLGSMIEGYLPGASIGSICKVFPYNNKKYILVEVIGLNGQKAIMMPFGDITGIKLGSPILMSRSRATVRVGNQLMGRIINGNAEPIDDKGPLQTDEEVHLYSGGINPMHRQPIREPISLGVKAIDGLITVGRGQRVGIMAGSGVGKSVLLGMMAQNTNADINVIALIGERGREVREFVEDILGEDGLKKSIVVAVTSDETALIRMRGAFLATSIAEFFAEKGLNVLLTMDSVTRFAMAQREIGLSTGEPPASRGYTPSVFSLLPKLLERAGNFEAKGSITGLYTVLVEGDDMDDPIADSIRSIVDGHIVLKRELAEKGQFPAIDVLSSASRVMRAVTSSEHIQAAMKIREWIAVYKEAEDLIHIGAYQEGSSDVIDMAIEKRPLITNFLKQDIHEASSIEQSVQELNQILGGRTP